VGRLAAAAILVVALVLAGTASASSHAGSHPVRSWASAEIAAVTSAGLMGAKTPATFRPDDTLTAQALANLSFALKQILWPPVPATPPPATPTPPPTSTDPTQTTTTTTTTSSDTTTTPTTTTVPTTTTTTTTTTPATPPAPPPTPPEVPHPNAPVTMTGLDAGLVDGLGLSNAAAEFAKGARAAGLQVPDRFGSEVVARLLGLRYNHPAQDDSLELLPGDPATRAEAAYSAAQILHFAGWEVAGVQSLADSFALPQLSVWQKRILDTAVARIGMPYVWGGTSDGPETDFGVPARGGYDCSGFVWRVYKLTSYPGEGDLASVLRGRTTFVMSVEVPLSERIHFADLQPADVIFFGDEGPSSSSAEVGHMGIYLGNGWFIHDSDFGVALAQLTGWYRQHFAWGRRPLREAGLSG